MSLPTAQLHVDRWLTRNLSSDYKMPNGSRVRMKGEAVKESVVHCRGQRVSETHRMATGNDSTDSVRCSAMSDAPFHISSTLIIEKSDVHWLFVK